MNKDMHERFQDSLSLMCDLPSQLIYTGQVYYNLTGEYCHIARMLRSLFFEHRDSIPSQKLLDIFSNGLEELNNLRPLKTFHVDKSNMFFDPALISLNNEEVFIDCGAMDMGTSMEFAFQCQDAFKKIVAFEPDPLCYEICRDNLMFFSKKKRGCIHLFDVGVSDYNGSASFERSSCIGTSRIVQKSADAIQVKKLDDIEECADATFIKLHVEGAEWQAIKGAETLITQNKPTLAISCYHNITELLEIPAFLKERVPTYHLYMRHYSTGTSESVLYAIDQTRVKRH